MTNNNTQQQWPKYRRSQQWQYEHIVLAGKPESIKWTDRRSEDEAKMFASNPTLSTGRIRSRVVLVEFANKNDWYGTVVVQSSWQEETVDQSTFDRMTAA